eukprot:g32902.t1
MRTPPSSPTAFLGGVEIWNRVQPNSIRFYEEETAHNLIEQLEDIKDIRDDLLLHPDRESEPSSPLSFPSSFSFPSPPTLPLCHPLPILHPPFSPLPLGNSSQPATRVCHYPTFRHGSLLASLLKDSPTATSARAVQDHSNIVTLLKRNLSQLTRLSASSPPRRLHRFFAFTATYPHHPCPFLVLTEEAFKAITPWYLSKKNDIVICQLCNVSFKGKTRVELKRHAKGRSHRKKWRKLGLDGLANTFGYDPYMYYDVAYGVHRDCDWKFGDEDKGQGRAKYESRHGAGAGVDPAGAGLQGKMTLLHVAYGAGDRPRGKEDGLDDAAHVQPQPAPAPMAESDSSDEEDDEEDDIDIINTEASRPCLPSPPPPAVTGLVESLAPTGQATQTALSNEGDSECMVCEEESLAPAEQAKQPLSPSLQGDKDDGLPAFNTTDRQYAFLTYDPWFEHHGKGEILLGLKSERTDVRKAQYDQVVRRIDDFLSEHSGRPRDMRERHLKAAILAGERRMKMYMELKEDLKREPTDAERQLAGAHADAYYPQDGKKDVPLGTGEFLPEQCSGNRDCVTHAYLNLLPPASTKKSSYRRRLARSLHTASVSAFCHDDARKDWFVDTDGVVWQPRLIKSASFSDITRRRLRGNLLVACD